MSEVPESEPASGLGEREQRLLEVERSWWRTGTDREAVAREELDLTPTDYHRALNAVIDTPEASAYDPVLVRRLQRLRDARRRRRSGLRSREP